MTGPDRGSPELEQADAAALRSRHLRLAVVTSLAGKGVSILVQLAAMPFAIRVLGADRFGVYAMLAAILNWSGIASVSVTPGLTVRLIAANARGDREGETTVVSTAFFFAAGIAAVLVLGAQLTIHLAGIESLFGARVAPYQAELVEGLNILTALLAANILLAVAEAAQAGYQNQYLQNLFATAGSAVTLVAVFLAVRHRPTISALVLAVFAGPVAARTMSALQLIWRRPHLLPRLRHVRGSVLRAMLGTGSAFIVTSLATFLYQSFSVYWVGRKLGPASAAYMSVMVTILGVSGSLLVMLTQPLWPAIQDAELRKDREWVRRAYARISRAVLLYAGLAGLTLAVLGGPIMGIWIKADPSIGWFSHGLLGLYFFLAAWEHVNYSVVIGLSRFWLASLSLMAGALVMLGSGTMLVGSWGLDGMLLAMCLGPLAFTSWAYPLEIRRLLAARVG